MWKSELNQRRTKNFFGAELERLRDYRIKNGIYRDSWKAYGKNSLKVKPGNDSNDPGHFRFSLSTGNDWKFSYGFLRPGNFPVLLQAYDWGKVKVRVNDLNLSSWLESMIKDVPSPGSKLFRNFVFLNVRHYSAG